MIIMFYWTKIIYDFAFFTSVFLMLENAILILKQSLVLGPDMGTTQFDSIQLSLKKFWFDSTHDSQWLYKNWFKSARDSIEIDSSLKKLPEYFDSNQLTTQNTSKNLDSNRYITQKTISNIDSNQVMT